MGKRASKFTIFAVFLIIVSIIANSSFSANALSSGKIIQIAASRDNTVMLLEDGTVWAWGDNSSGQLGTNDTVSSDTPVLVPDIKNIKGVSAGHGFSAAVKQDGTVWVWGSNLYGQLGIGIAAIKSA